MHGRSPWARQNAEPLTDGSTACPQKVSRLINVRFDDADPEKRLQRFKAQAKSGPPMVPRPSLSKARPAWAGLPDEIKDESAFDD
jgi:hypothetical protein